MSPLNMKKSFAVSRLLPVAFISAAVLLLAPAVQAAVPGIKGTTFNLVASPAFITQPDGNFVYSWGYGCSTPPAAAAFAPAGVSGAASCSTMQIPGPTLIVQAPVSGVATVTINLTNTLPAAAGNTSILFPGFAVATSGGVAGLLTQEAVPCSTSPCVPTATNTVTYTLTIPSTAAGTHAYYSGTQGDLQIDMGLYGAIVVLPSAVPAACTSGVHASNVAAQGSWSESDNRLAAAAYNHPGACYDREYLFQFSEMDLRLHQETEEQVTAKNGCTVGAAGCNLNVATEPYDPTYFMINGRSMPDNMDPAYVAQYPHQPYNGNPHMHPGELTLLRVIGTGRWQHPFHEHGNHVRILARDGNLILSQTDPANNLAGPLLFTTTTTPGLAMDGIFYWTGKGVNWDLYGHNPASTDASAKLPCVADANGYNTGAPTAINYFEWCQDHNKPLQKAPYGDLPSGGPVTLPEPTLFANGAWFGGSPYLGPDATKRAVGSTGTTPPSGTVANSPSDEAGFAFMWHSHNEREITTNNIFPGGMLMMMLVDSREFVIDETK
jgi:FtsP/CotA-like multicopper oxidase with cupredoxin domain